MINKDILMTWVEEALQSGIEDPNEALIEIANKHLDDMNEEVLKRLVEMYNVERFLELKTTGFDMEENFPIAKYEVILPSVLNKSIKEVKEAYYHKKEAEFRGIENTTPVDTSMNIPYMEKQGSHKIENWEDPPKKEAYNYEMYYTAELLKTKVAEYIKKLPSTSDKFKAEVKYLFPKSELVQAMKLEKVAMRIPEVYGPEHREFATVNAILEKKK